MSKLPLATLAGLARARRRAGINGGVRYVETHDVSVIWDRLKVVTEKPHVPKNAPPD